ncbi:thioredoxin-like domain-containing protein [Chitinophaga sp.]|uniref:thioredoxin-like domain-containing protein n=1 Tax=Chitinophaga sp. TaxID=1869181 RepID=UPI002F936FD5
MKKLSICLLLVCAFIAAQAQEEFIIEGKVSGERTPRKIFLRYWTNHVKQETHRDSALVINGSFTFKGMVNGTMYARLSTGELFDEYPLEQSFFIEKGVTKVIWEERQRAVFSGNKTLAENDLYELQMAPYYKKNGELAKRRYEAATDNNDTAVARLDAVLKASLGESLLKGREFFAAHPDSYVSLIYMLWYLKQFEPRDLEPLLNNLSPRLHATEEWKSMTAALAIMKKTAVGATPDFTQNNTEGVGVPLSSLRGKYVLVDFWASWCVPCRKENPNVVKAYEKFRSRNFEIMSVSLDNNKENWLKAIEEDHLTWIHVSDLKGWKNDVAVEYGISSVPQNFLLDPNGRVIAKNLRGEELGKKLEELIRN